MFVDGTTDFEMTRGDDEFITVRLKNRDFKPGDTVTLTVRKNPGSTDVALQKTVTEFDANVCTIHIEPDDTNGLPWGRYWYDIESVVNGYKKTIVKPSLFNLLWEVTYET